MSSTASKEPSPNIITSTATKVQSLQQEFENLESLHDSIREVVCSPEKMEGMPELEKLEYEEKLLRIQIKREEFKEKLIRLKEDQILSTDRAKRVEDLYAKLHEEHYKMMRVKNKKISELKEKLTEMKNQIREKDEIVRACQEKIESYGTRVVEKDQELKNMKRQKLAADRTIKEMRRTQLEVLRFLEETRDELRSGNLEGRQTMVDLTSQAKELDGLVSTAMRTAGRLASPLKVEARDLRNQHKKGFAGSKVEVQDLGCGSTQGADKNNATNFVERLPGVPSTCHNSDVECEVLSKTGGRDMPHSSQTKKEQCRIKNTTENSPQTVAEANSNGANQVQGSKKIQGSGVEIMNSDDENKLGSKVSPTIVAQKRKRRSDDGELQIQSYKEKQIVESAGKIITSLTNDHLRMPNSGFVGLEEKIIPYTRRRRAKK